MTVACVPVAACCERFGLALILHGWSIALASAGILFDDFANLSVLGYYGSVDNWKAFWLYLTCSADPTGRPLALLSFLLDRYLASRPLRVQAHRRPAALLNGALLPGSS